MAPGLVGKVGAERAEMERERAELLEQLVRGAAARRMGGERGWRCLGKRLGWGLGRGLEAWVVRSWARRPIRPFLRSFVQ